MLSLTDRMINLVGILWYRLWKFYRRFELQVLILGLVFIWIALGSALYLPAFGPTFDTAGLLLALVVSATIILFFWIFTVSWEERKK